MTNNKDFYNSQLVFGGGKHLEGQDSKPSHFGETNKMKITTLRKV